MTLGKADTYFTGAKWFFGPFWMSAENVTSGIRYPDSHPVAFPYTQYDISAHKYVKMLLSPVTGLEFPRGFQEIKVPKYG